MSGIENDLDEKRVFLVAIADPARRKLYSEWIERHISGSRVYTSHDGSDALFKLENVPPRVLVTEIDLEKVNGIDLVDRVIRMRRSKQDPDTSVIILSALPDQEHFVEEVVTGKVQFLTKLESETDFAICLTKGLNRSISLKDNEYSLKFLSKDEVLFREGDDAHSVFVVKRGKLFAYKGSDKKPITLGDISNGEFIGEMAYLNKEARSATVKAVEDCELIEIPNGSLDTVLFSKPAWSKALLLTLSKRLKTSNESILKTQA